MIFSVVLPSVLSRLFDGDKSDSCSYLDVSDNQSMIMESFQIIFGRSLVSRR